MTLNAAEFRWYLEKISFPANKMEIVNLADSSHATDAVMDLLRQLPDQDYSSVDDVIAAAGIPD